jgi:hypothetical protein
MIVNEAQYEATKVHLELFEQAAANIVKRAETRTKLEQLELDAVHAQADDLRSEIAAYLLRASEETATKHL